MPEVTRVKDLMCRFHAACEQAKNREEYLLKYGVYEYVFTRKEEPDVIKGVLIPDCRASQWEHTFYYKNGSRECDYCGYARDGTWTASPIYTIDENTGDPLKMIELEPVPRSKLGLTHHISIFTTSYQPVKIARLIIAENDWLADDY